MKPRLRSLQALMVCSCAAQACDSQAARSPETKSREGRKGRIRLHRWKAVLLPTCL